MDSWFHVIPVTWTLVRVVNPNLSPKSWKLSPCNEWTLLSKDQLVATSET